MNAKDWNAYVSRISAGSDMTPCFLVCLPFPLSTSLISLVWLWSGSSAWFSSRLEGCVIGTGGAAVAVSCLASSDAGSGQLSAALVTSNEAMGKSVNYNSRHLISDTVVCRRIVLG